LGTPAPLAAVQEEKVEHFLKDYIRECQRLDFGIPSILAHSYGTYIAAHAMLKYPQIKFDRMILCGAILRPEFPWDKVAANGQVRAVLNQYGGQDFWAWAVAWGGR
jgi:pimeloyl-ACP methyl ester carboxylesterase